MVRKEFGNLMQGHPSVIPKDDASMLFPWRNAKSGGEKQQKQTGDPLSSAVENSKPTSAKVAEDEDAPRHEPRTPGRNTPVDHP